MACLAGWFGLLLFDIIGGNLQENSAPHTTVYHVAPVLPTSRDEWALLALLILVVKPGDRHHAHHLRGELVNSIRSWMCRLRLRYGSCPTKRVFLPSYSPELNPTERILGEMRRRLEERVYESLKAKQAEVEGYLRELGGDRGRAKRLCGWEWMHETLKRAPPLTRRRFLTKTPRKIIFGRVPCSRFADTVIVATSDVRSRKGKRDGE